MRERSLLVQLGADRARVRVPEEPGLKPKQQTLRQEGKYLAAF